MQPEHQHANRILQNWPDRQAMGQAWRNVPKPLRPRVGDLVKQQQQMFDARRYFAWCTVRPEEGEESGQANP